MFYKYYSRTSFPFIIVELLFSWEKLLVQLAHNFSEDHLKLLNRNSLKAILKLKDSRTIIESINITYTIKMDDEFEK